MIKKYIEYIKEEVGFRNLKDIVHGKKYCEIWFHKDLDGVTSAIAMKEFLKNYYQIETIDCHTIQYGGLEFSVTSGLPDTLKIICDFSHGKPIFNVHLDHHDKQTGSNTSSNYFKSSRSNAEVISGEISYSDIFNPKDIDLIKTIDSADFLKYNIKPEDIHNSIFKYIKSETSVKNRFMMGFVVNRLLLAYKNKRITCKSLDGKKNHISKNILECIVLDSTGSLYSMFNNIRNYINNAKTNDKSGVLATPEEISKNLSDYTERMKNYKYIEDPISGDVQEYDPKKWAHRASKIGTGLNYDDKYKIISQYGGGSMFKPGSYDRYVPFKNYPESEFICIVWPMGLLQVSCNPFKEKRLKDINLGEISKEVLSKHESILRKFFISLESIKNEFETSQDWKKMKKEEGDNYRGVGFKYNDLESFYKDCVYKKTDKGIINYNIQDDFLIKSMNTLYDDLNDSEKKYLKELKIPAWEIIIRNSGGHPSITNISGLNFLKYNKPALKIAYNTEKYVDVLKIIARDFINNLQAKIDSVNGGNSIEYNTKGVKLLGNDLNENFEYIINKNGSLNKVTRDEFIKAGISKAMKTDKEDLIIDTDKKRIIAKFEGYKTD